MYHFCFTVISKRKVLEILEKQSQQSAGACWQYQGLEMATECLDQTHCHPVSRDATHSGARLP